MKRSTVISTGSIAAIAAGGVLMVGPAHAAAGLKTLHLTTHSVEVTSTSKSTFAESDRVAKAGKTVGYETLSCNDGGTGVKCSISIGLKNGTLYGYVTSPISTTPKTTLTGKITGGLGKYADVKGGSVKAKVNGKNAKYTITFH